jgi:hypothetical protein
MVFYELISANLATIVVWLTFTTMAVFRRLWNKVYHENTWPLRVGVTYFSGRSVTYTVDCQQSIHLKNNGAFVDIEDAIFERIEEIAHYNCYCETPKFLHLLHTMNNKL